MHPSPPFCGAGQLHLLKRRAWPLPQERLQKEPSHSHHSPKTAIAMSLQRVESSSSKNIINIIIINNKNNNNSYNNNNNNSYN